MQGSQALVSLTKLSVRSEQISIYIRIFKNRPVPTKPFMQIFMPRALCA